MPAIVQRISEVMRPRRLRVVAAAALLTVASLAGAQWREGHPDTYVVKRGDTLWDIAGRFLQRPWLWPEIWQANPQIRNPHLIYPGDVISLAYLDRLGVAEGPRDGAPIDAVPLAQVEPFLKDIRIYDRIDQLPYVVGLEDDRMRATRGHLAYVRGLGSAPVGQRFAVMRPVQVYTEGRRGATGFLRGKDDLDFAGRRDLDPPYDRTWSEIMLARGGRMEKLGTEMRQVNTGVITRGEVGGIQASTLLLDDANVEVRVGDKVVAVEAIPYDLAFYPHPPKQQMPYGKLQVLSVADMLTSGGPRDVVAISGGTREGIDNGTVFSIWRQGSRAPDRVQYPERSEDLVPDGGRVRLPDEFAGHVMVFRTFEKVSYGLVMASVKPTRVGYELKHPDAAY